MRKLTDICGTCGHQYGYHGLKENCPVDLSENTGFLETTFREKIANPLFVLEIGDGSFITTDVIAITEKAKELGLLGHVSESKNPFSCGGVPLQRVHFTK